MSKKYVIALGREYASGGREIGKMLASRLGINYYDNNELRKKAKELGVEEGVFEMFDEQPTRSFLFSVAFLNFAEIMISFIKLSSSSNKIPTKGSSLLLAIISVAI